MVLWIDILENEDASISSRRVVGLRAGMWNKFIFEPYVGPEDDVLDFGCGGGYLLRVLSPQTAVGVEINPVARETAANLGIEVYATLDEVKGRAFSRVVTSHALEHVPSPYQALVELRPLIRVNGLLIWLSPMDDWRAKAQREWRSGDRDMHLCTWTPLLMGNLLTAAGYHPKSISLVTHAWPPGIVRDRLWQISPAAFHMASRLWAILRKRRQILAVASPGHD